MRDTTASRRWRKVRDSLRAHLPFLIAVAILLPLSLYNTFHKSIWLDESFSLDTANRALGDTLSRALRFELQAPLYFVLLHFWLKLSPTLEVARLLSTACAVGTVWVMHRLARLLNIGDRTMSLAVLAALSPQIIWSSSETRGYSLTIFLTTCATYYFARIWVADSAKTLKDYLLYGLFCYLAILNFYYAGFLVAAFFVAAVITRAPVRPLVIAHAVLGALVLPWVPVVAMQMSRHPNYTPRPTFEVGEVLATLVSVAHWAAQTLFYAFFIGAPRLAHLPGVLPGLVILAAVTVLALARDRARRWGRAEAAFVATATLPCLVLLAIAGFRISHVQQRHWAIAVANVLVLLALLVARISSVQVRRAVGLLYTALFALAAISYQVLHDVDVWPEVASYLAANERPGEPILFFSAYGALPFRYVYHGHAQVRGIPDDSPWESEWIAQKYHTERSDVNEAFFRDSLLQAVAGRRSFWLVTWSVGGADPDVAALLERYVKARMTLRETRDFGAVSGEEFRGVRVSRFEVPATSGACNNDHERGPRCGPRP